MGLLPEFIEFPAPGLRYAVELHPTENPCPLNGAGAARRLILNDGPRSVVLAERGETLEVYAPRRGSALHILVLQGFAKLLARQILPDYLNAVADEIGVSGFSLRIGDQRRRWGSCSLTDAAHPKICLNWRALLLQAPLLRQLNLHELCHILEMSHSKKFHELMARHNPDERSAERELGLAWKNLPPWAVHYRHLIPGRRIRG